MFARMSDILGLTVVIFRDLRMLIMWEGKANGEWMKCQAL